MKKYSKHNPQLLGESAELSDKAQLSLEKKSENSGIPVEILGEVYRRGYKCWTEAFGQTAEQFAFDRVNSFIAGGFARQLDEDLAKACWKGYEAIGMKKKNGKTVPNCVPVKEATYQGKKVPLNKPMKGDVKKSKVYVDPDGDGIAKKVNFGDKTLSIKKNNPDRKRSYCARSSGQGNLTDKTSANYWSRRAWNCEETEVTEGKVKDTIKRAAKIAMVGSNLTALATAMEPSSTKDPGHALVQAASALPGTAGWVATGAHYALKDKTKEFIKGKFKEEAETHSKDPKKPSSRFVGSDELVKVYKDMTPGYKDTIKKVVKEQLEMQEASIYDNDEHMIGDRQPIELPKGHPQAERAMAANRNLKIAKQQHAHIWRFSPNNPEKKSFIAPLKPADHKILSDRVNYHAGEYDRIKSQIQK